MGHPVLGPRWSIEDGNASFNQYILMKISQKDSNLQQNVRFSPKCKIFMKITHLHGQFIDAWINVTDTTGTFIIQISSESFLAWSISIARPYSVMDCFAIFSLLSFSS